MNNLADSVDSDPIGPWPFITRRILQRQDARPKVWHARHHRKGLVTPESLRREAALRVVVRSLWMPAELNWWIGMIFAIGSTFFAVASVFFLMPAASVPVSSSEISRLYFAGSIPFTLAAWLQLYQAANAPRIDQAATAGGRRKLFGWRPKSPGWISCALQFLGTLLFNMNTFNGMNSSFTWVEYNVYIWTPNFVGSILFLMSGYLAFIETCHSFWAWRLGSLSWWVVLINLLGCIGFMLSAVFAVMTSSVGNQTAEAISVAFTLQGAVCFFVGAVLMLPETACEELAVTT